MNPKYFLLALLFPIVLQTKAQTDVPPESPLRPGIDFVSRYVWRGLLVGGNTFHAQPTLKFVSDKHGIEFGTWGSYSFNGEITETDWLFSYAPVSAFKITINDYFLPADNTLQNYFEWDQDSTNHTLEAMLSFNGTEKIPFTATFAINFYGFDARNATNKPVYSKYFELGYFKDIRNTTFKAFVGAALDKPDEGTTGYYAQTDIGIINAGITVIKKIHFNEKFFVPVSVSVISNPQAENIFFVFALTL